MSSKDSRIFGLDFIRALAITGVIVGHGIQLLPFSISRYIRVFDIQTWGVELFFVLSGFLIGGILLGQQENFHRPISLFEFWYRRWMRTLPAYYLFVGVYLLLGLILSSPFPPLLNYLTFTQNFAYPRITDFFAVAWSLSVEEWFYLLLPLGIFIANRLIRDYEKAFLGAALFFLIVPALIRATSTDLVDAREIVIMRLDAIMFGVLAVWFRRRYPDAWQKWRYRLLVFGIVLAVAVEAIFIGVRIVDADIRALNPLVILTLMPLSMVALLPAAEHWVISRENRFTRTVRRIAHWSYALYLCHSAILLTLLAVQAALAPDSLWLSVLLCLVFHIASVAAAWAIYRFYEKPIMDLRDRYPLGQMLNRPPLKKNSAP